MKALYLVKLRTRDGQRRKAMITTAPSDIRAAAYAVNTLGREFEVTCTRMLCPTPKEFQLTFDV